MTPQPWLPCWAAQEIYESYDADKFADDDARWSRAYRRVRGALREKARNMTHSVDGMIVCRMTDKDFNRKQYDYAMFIAETKGKEQALKDKLINEDGQPLYKWGDDAGKVILGDDKKPGRPLASGRAIGYTFEKDEEGNYTIIEPRYIVIGKDKSEDTIPVCQIGKLLLSIADKKQNGFFANNNFAYYNDASLSNEHKTPYTFDEVKEILGQWNHVFGDNFAAISNVKDLQSFVDEHAYSKDNKDNEYDFCAIPGIVSAIIPNESKYGNARVVLEFIDYDTLETSLLTVFLPQLVNNKILKIIKIHRLNISCKFNIIWKPQIVF